MYRIVFNQPHVCGQELHFVQDAVARMKLSGNGYYTQQCHKFLKDRFGFKHVLLTTSCTDALEMCALLANIQPGDEVILPSFTFVSTANAFVLRGAKLVFADSYPDNPNIDASKVEALVTPRTKAIVPVHYAGVACDMDALMDICKRHGLYLIEDAAQAVDSRYKGQPLGSIGHLAAFSFHETKNISCGEGGLLAVNAPELMARSEILWEKGTNRAAFFRGEVDKYGWVDVGSSFLASELNAAFLWAQLLDLDTIQSRRRAIWQRYYDELKPLEQAGKLSLPVIPDYAEQNGHLFYITCNSGDDRQKVIDYAKGRGIHLVFHYLSLHKSPYYQDRHSGAELPNADHFTETLVRLPLHMALSDQNIDEVVSAIHECFQS